MLNQLLTALFDLQPDTLWQNVSGIFDLLLSTLASLVFSLASDAAHLFQVAECNRSSCPGSFYLPVVAAWANIGYMTHADFVYFVWNTSFGLWAALFYAVGAAGALVSVSINQPPRTYMWFFIGPALYSFLVGTPTTVQGVSWRIANKSMQMEDVWRDAETGLANTALVQDVGIQVGRKDAPNRSYQVAWAMVFLDGVFSEATNNLVSWIGTQRKEGRGGADTNLFSKDTEQGPWQILANLKWGMVENIVGVNVKDPDVRDTLATFLTSECGDWFKKGVNAGAYSAASQSRGANLPGSVLIDSDNPSTTGLNDNPVKGSYRKFVHGLDIESIPTPRSMVRLFNAPNITGSFRQFSTKFSGNQALDSGRLNEIVCSEYLYMIIEAMRWEAGHAYWQLIRSFPNGFQTEAMALKTLFYGWNLREGADASMLSDEGVIKYTKFLILAHMFRNELMIAPQITELGQRFSTSEQMRGFTEAHVRQQGSRAKYGELYQWAVMMPHVQGILVYLILIGYPFAAMLMVIPGYWKAFFTWVSFFAWVKLWDVGFAIVHTLERSVWAMIGNNSAMARVGRRLINTANNGNGDILVNCGGGATGGTSGTGASQKLSELCSVPTVKEASAIGEDDAWFLLDQILTVAGSLDLDLSNGYYIYIMAALYFAVPAVTGQLVLGAKAGLGGLATQGLSQSAGEAGGAAKSGTVGENATRMGANSAAIDQAAKFKSFRQSGFAQQSLDAQNAAMDADIRGAEIGGQQKYAETVGGMRDLTANAQGASRQAVTSALFGDGAGTAGFFRMPAQGVGGFGAGAGAEGELAQDGPQSPAPVSNGTGSAGGAAAALVGSIAPAILAKGVLDRTKAGQFLKGLAKSPVSNLVALAATGMAAENANLQKSAIHSKALSSALGADLGWDSSANNLFKAGHQVLGQQRLTPAMQFNASEDSWAAKNSYGANAGMHAVMGASPASTGAGGKDSESMGAIMNGQGGADARKAALYAGSQYFLNAGSAMARGKQNMGGQSALGFYQNNTIGFDTGRAIGKATKPFAAFRDAHKTAYDGTAGTAMEKGAAALGAGGKAFLESATELSGMGNLGDNGDVSAGFEAEAGKTIGQMGNDTSEAVGRFFEDMKK
jgi:hypothetical protein